MKRYETSFSCCANISTHSFVGHSARVLRYSVEKWPHKCIQKKENIEPTYASRTIRLHNAFALVLLHTRFAKLFAKIVIRNRRIRTHSNACVNFTIRDHPLAPVVPRGLGFYPFHLVRFHLHHLLGIFLEGVLTRLHFLLLRFVITFPAFLCMCVWLDTHISLFLSQTRKDLHSLHRPRTGRHGSAAGPGFMCKLWQAFPLSLYRDRAWHTHTHTHAASIATALPHP